MSVEDRTLKKDDMNASRMRGGVQPAAIENVVSGVYRFGPNPVSPLLFEHRDQLYELSWTDIEEGMHRTVDLVQSGLGSRYDGRQETEAFVVVQNRGINLVEEFQKGGLVYSREEHGKSIVQNFPDLLTGGAHYLNVHSIRTEMSQSLAGDLRNAYLVVFASETHKMLSFDVEEKDSDDVISTPHRFTLEESPEWALEKATFAIGSG